MRFYLLAYSQDCCTECPSSTAASVVPVSTASPALVLGFSAESTGAGTAIIQQCNFTEPVSYIIINIIMTLENIL